MRAPTVSQTVRAGEARRIEWKRRRRANTTAPAAMLASIPIEVVGPLAAASVVWRIGAQTRVTVIVKTSVGYEPTGRVRAVDADPVVAVEVDARGRRCELAPFLRGAHVVCLGQARAGAREVALYVKRGNTVLLERAVPASAASSLGPVPAEAREGLARFGAGVVSVEAGLDGHRLSTAPREQRMGPLRGHETIVLEGLDPEVASVAIPLPPLELRFAVLMGAVPVPFSAQLDTLALEPSTRRLSMVWRGNFAVREEDLGAVRASVALKVDQTVGQTVAQTVAPPDLAASSTPFSPRAGKAPPPLAASLHTAEPTGTVSLGGFIQPARATPFEAPQPARNVTALLSREELRRAAAGGAVPFDSGPPSPRRQQPHAPIPGAPWAGDEHAPVTPPSDRATTTLFDASSEPERRVVSRAEVASEPHASHPDAEGASPPKTPEELERERPKEAWARGPELDHEAANAPPKRAKRKDLNAFLYPRKKP